MFKRLKVVAGSVLALALLFALATQWRRPTSALAGQLERRVQFAVAYKYEPVVITKVMLGDILVQSGRYAKPITEPEDPITPFQADDDWIQNLKVYLLNRTKRTIVFANVRFTFPETGDGRVVPVRGFDLNLGRIPVQADFDRHGNPFPQSPHSHALAFRPGQTIVVALGDHLELIKPQVESVLPLVAVTKLTIDRGSLYFEDGMQWGGGFRVPDRQNLTWRPMDRDYFPGDMDWNWPGRPGWTGQ